MLSKAKSIVSRRLEDYERVKNLLEPNIGYVGQFTHYLFNENIPYDELYSLYTSLKELKSKFVNIDISKYSYEELLDTIQTRSDDLEIKKFTNQLPSTQKKLTLDMNKIILLKAARKDNMGIFLSKVSRYKDTPTLLSALRIFCLSDEFDNTKENITQRISNLKSTVVYDKGSILIVYVDSYEDIQILANDTSWCIVSHKSQWKSYTRGKNQFILFNYNLDMFDSEFKIGFTCNTNNITAAFDILDKDVIPLIRNTLDQNDIKIEDIYKDDQNHDDIKDGDSIIHKEFGFGKVTKILYNKISVKFSGGQRTLANFDTFIIHNRKLSSNTPINYWEKVIPYLPIDVAITWCNKYINWRNKSYSSKRNLLNQFIDRILISKEYCTTKFINNINKGYKDYINLENHPKIFNKKHLPSNTISTKPFIRAFIDGLWTDAIIEKTCTKHFLNSIISKYVNNDCIGLDNLTIVYYKLLDIYNNIKSCPQGLEITLMVLNKYLNLPAMAIDKFGKNYDTIIKTSSYQKIFKDYQHIVKPPLNPEEECINSSEVKYVIKKDYKVIKNSPYFGKVGYTHGFRINMDILNMYENLIKHLEGYEFTIGISRDQLKKFMSELGGYKNCYTERGGSELSKRSEYLNSYKIYNMLYELGKKKRILIGSFIYDEEKKVKIFVEEF